MAQAVGNNTWKKLIRIDVSSDTVCTIVFWGKRNLDKSSTWRCKCNLHSPLCADVIILTHFCVWKDLYVQCMYVSSWLECAINLLFVLNLDVVWNGTYLTPCFYFCWSALSLEPEFPCWSAQRPPLHQAGNLCISNSGSLNLTNIKCSKGRLGDLILYLEFTRVVFYTK